MTIISTTVGKSPLYPGNFPDGPVVKNPPSNAGDTDLIPDQGIKSSHAMGQPSQSTLEPVHCDKIACATSN